MAKRFVIKPEIRVIGFDDGPFKRGDRKVLVVGVILRAKEYLDGLLSTTVRVDGLDATQKVISLVKKSRHYDQLRVLLFDGLAFGGFNVFDIKKISKETGKMAIAVIKKRPDVEKFLSAMARLPNYKKRLAMVKAAGPIFETVVRDKRIYYQCAGISPQDAAEVLRRASMRSSVPEAIRLAHIIASGVVEGESRGRP